MKTFNEIAAEYAPYHTFHEFQIGAQDYMDGKIHERYTGVGAQAYDRGRNAAMWFTRQHGGLSPVGAKQALARIDDRKDFTKHLTRLRRLVRKPIQIIPMKDTIMALCDDGRRRK